MLCKWQDYTVTWVELTSQNWQEGLAKCISTGDCTLLLGELSSKTLGGLHTPRYFHMVPLWSIYLTANPLCDQPRHVLPWVSWTANHSSLHDLELVLARWYRLGPTYDWKKTEQLCAGWPYAWLPPSCMLLSILGLPNSCFTTWGLSTSCGTAVI